MEAAGQPLLHLMFDIDGTLLDSHDVDTRCFVGAVREVTGREINTDWAQYEHATDAGILQQFMDDAGLHDQDRIRREVQGVFIDLLDDAVRSEPVKEIPGAGAFLQHLSTLPKVTVSMATGCWQASAILKLQSAGISYKSFSLSTSDDAIDRVGIMTLSTERATAGQIMPSVYFGDGVWDQKACAAMGIDFVLVGDGVNHRPAIPKS